MWRFFYLDRLSKSALANSMFDDARIYWAWAERIAHGHVVGTNPFFLAPLYPYVLGLMRALGVGTPSSVLFLQSLWGAGAAVLLADAVRRLTTPIIGLALGLILIVYQMAVFFDGLILSESLLFFLGSLLLWWVVRSDWSRPSWRTTVVVGVLIGLLAAGRGTAVVLVLPAALLVVRRSDLAGSVRRAGVVLAGFALVVAPVALHNVAVAHEWIPLTYNTGFNLYVGNNPRSSGTYVPITGNRVGQPLGLDGGVELDGRDYLERVEGLRLSPAGSSAYWTSKATSYVANHPGHTLGLMAIKLGMLWNTREFPQIENVEEYGALAGPVGLPVVGSFAILGALALMGAAFSWRSGVAARFALGSALVLTLSTLPFFVTDRYRHMLIPGCAILAGLGLHRLWTAWSDGSRRKQALAALAAGLVVVYLPTPGPTELQKAALLAKNMGLRLQQSAFLAAQSGRLDDAERDFAQAVQDDPRLYESWGGLIRAQVQLGHTEQARETFARARAAGLPDPAASAYEGLFAAFAHDRAAAESALQRIPQSSLDTDQNLAQVVAVARRILSQGP